MVYQLQSSAQGDSNIADWDTTATTLHDTAAQELTFVVADPPSGTDPVTPNSGDESEVYDIAAVFAEKKPGMSGVSHFRVAHVPVPWGRLTKVVVLDVFNDVHSGLGTLGPPLQISMNPNLL